jgi:hypothetical protein
VVQKLGVIILIGMILEEMRTIEDGFNCYLIRHLLKNIHRIRGNDWSDRQEATFKRNT